MADMSVIQNPFGTMPTSPLLGVNPMQGALTGMGLPMTAQSGQNVLQSQDIQNMSDLDKLKMRQESEDPMNRAKNSLDQSQAEALNNPELIQAGIQQKLAQAQAAQMDSQSNMLAQKADFIYKLGTEIEAKQKAGQPTYDPMNKTSKDWWDRQVEEGKKFGFNLPAAPDMRPDGGSDTISAIVNKKNALNIDPRFWQKMQELDKTNSNTLEHAKIGAQAVTDAAKIHVGGQVEAAKIGADSRVQSSEIRAAATQSNAALVNIIANDIRAGKPPSDALVNLAGGQAYDADSKSTGLGLASLLAFQKGDLEGGNKLKQAWIDNWKKSTFPDLYNGGKSSSPQTGTTQATPTSAPSTPAGSKYVPGYVEDGYKFNGGDPKDKKNWSKE